MFKKQTKKKKKKHSKQTNKQTKLYNFVMPAAGDETLLPSRQSFHFSKGPQETIWFWNNFGSYEKCWLIEPSLELLKSSLKWILYTQKFELPLSSWKILKDDYLCSIRKQTPYFELKCVSGWWCFLWKILKCVKLIYFLG